MTHFKNTWLERMSGWAQVKWYFGVRKGNVIPLKRKEYLKDLQISEGTVDQYRLILYRAGYLEQVKPGVYMRVRRIPQNLSLSEARREAYAK